MREVAMGIDEQKREMLTREWLDRRTEAAAGFLLEFEELIKRVDVDAAGKIVVMSEEKVPVGAEWQFLRRFEDMLGRFEDGNNICAEQYAAEANVIDSRVVYGAVVVVYNSARGLPGGFSKDLPRGDFSGPSDFWAKDEKGRAIKLNRLTLITVDFNPEKRRDGVKPGVSLRHELAHHNVAVTDYLTSGEASLWMKSAYRAGRNRALYGDSRNRLTTKAAFDADLDKYEILLGRKKAEINQDDIDRQLGYLDELFASGRQRKSDWFSAGGVVYNNRGDKGRYWQVVGSHPEDRLAAGKLLGYLQATYLCELVDEGNSQLALLMDGMLAIAGAGRTVLQAERLAGKQWEGFREKQWAKELITKPRFVEWREEVYRSGWGIEGLKNLFSLV